MSNENYIFDASNELIDLSGELMHKILTYIQENHTVIESSIQKFSCSATLNVDNWDSDSHQYKLKEAKIDEENTISFAENDDIFITPKDESKNIYQECGVQAATEIDDEGNIVFKCETEPKENLEIFVLVLREINKNKDFSNVLNEGDSQNGSI